MQSYIFSAEAAAVCGGVGSTWYGEGKFTSFINIEAGRELVVCSSVLCCCCDLVVPLYVLQVCLEQQQQQPILQELKSVLGSDQQLVVSCAAVSQFEVLLQQFSGSERQRWEQLLPQLRVYHCSAGCTSSGTSNNTAGHQQPCAVCGERLVQQQAVGVHAPGGADQSNGTEQLQLLPQLEGCCFPLSERLRSLEKMSLLQQAVFSLGDALHAVTVTANGSAVRAAAACGVHVDAVQHRPVWLTGL